MRCTDGLLSGLLAAQAVAGAALGAPAAPAASKLGPGPAAEVVLGEATLKRFLAARPLSGDGALALRVGRIGQALALVSDRPDVVDSFLVVSGRELQAYSFTGGTVCLTDSLAQLLASDDELAFAIAHELAHVALRHVVSEVVFNQALEAGKAHDVPAAQSLYAQSAELEADRYGALYLCRAGYRFTAAIGALQKLAGANTERDADARHPGYAERIAVLERVRVELERSLEAFERGKTALVAGRADEAVDMFKLFAAAFPQSVAGHVDLGSAFLARARSLGGVPAGLEEVVPFLPDPGVAIRGPIPEIDVQRAQEQFRRALALNPEDPVAPIGLALALLRLADFAGARAQLEKRIAHGGTDPEVLLCLGNAQVLGGDVRAAAETYTRALALRPRWPAGSKNLALAREALGEGSDARALWESLIDDPKLGAEARRHVEAGAATGAPIPR